MKIFLLKGLVSLLLIIIGLIEFRSQNLSTEQAGSEVRSQLLSAGLKKVSLIIVLFISYLALTLTYSSNPAYGFQKILNFIISIVPSVLIFYYLISTITERRIKLFIYSLGIISVLTVSYIIIDYPFDQSMIYHYKPGRWSHVIYGRMISSIALVLLLYLMWMIERAARLHSVTPRLAKEEARLLPKSLATVIQVLDALWQGRRWEIIFLIFVTSMAVYGTYLSALRAAFVGLMLVGGGLLIHSLWFVSQPFTCRLPAGRQGRQVCSAWLKRQKDINIKTKDKAPSTNEQGADSRQVSPVAQVFSTLLTLTILSALLILLVPKPDIINFRLDNMTAFDDLQFKGDPAIHSRLDYWQLSLEIINDNSVIGVGMGGFSSYHKVEVYPHNIILEFAVEGGVVGLLVLCSLFVVMFKNIFHLRGSDNTSPVSHLTFHIFPFTFFLFALWLALFSKEFSNQSLLWIWLAFVGVEKDKRSKEKD